MGQVSALKGMLNLTDYLLSSVMQSTEIVSLMFCTGEASLSTFTIHPYLHIIHILIHMSYSLLFFRLECLTEQLVTHLIR